MTPPESARTLILAVVVCILLRRGEADSSAAGRFAELRRTFLPCDVKLASFEMRYSREGSMTNVPWVWPANFLPRA
jgi:hypothetical protein